MEVPPSSASGSSNTTLQDVFDRVSTLVRETPESSELATSSDVKLRLYGLYKHITCGPCASNDNHQQLPSIFQPVARAKYQAWQACQDITNNDEAMDQYIQLVASQDHWLGHKCREWMQQYQENKQQAVLENDMKVSDDTSLTNEKDHQTSSNANNVVVGSNTEEPPNVHANPTMRSPTLATKSHWKPRKQPQPLPRRPKSWSETWLGVKPVIPRGQLDIDLWDLIFVLMQCILQSSTMFRYHQLDQRIKKVVGAAAVATATANSTNGGAAFAKQAKDQGNDNEVKVVVGLSVRSLLDLYLLARKYPPQSQVIMVPPINIPGMVHVLEHHDLQVVAVDVPSSANDGNTDDDYVCVAVDVQAVERAITPQTVAILVVHPFGMISACAETMKQLDELARQHDLDVLEDCAECFTGLHGPSAYLGSPYSKISFFSFGLIKTSTSLGGAMALLRPSVKGDSSSTSSASYLATKMDRTQFTLYRPSSLRDYAWKVVISMFICLATTHPVVYGLIIALCERLGLDFDNIAVRMTRSFAMPAGDGSGGGTTTIHVQNELISKLRKRPCNALMSLLYRRLQNPALSVAKRMARCHQMTQQLAKLQIDGLILPPSCGSGKNTWWLYPIRTTLAAPDDICRSLRQHGFDATRSTSQLGCVWNASSSMQGSCPRALRFMEQVLYLPVGSLSEQESSYLAQTLQHVMTNLNTPPPTEHDVFSSSSSSNVVTVSGWNKRRLANGALALIVIDVFLFRGKFLLTLLWRAIPVIASWSLVLFFGAILFTHVLRWCIADYYVETSDAFAKYNAILRDPPIIDADLTSSADEHPGSSPTVVASSMLSKIKAIQIVRDSRPTSDGSARALVTGATGFIGSLLLRDILRLRDTLGFSAGVVVLCRSKRGKSASDRISELLRGEMFSFLSDEEKATLVVTLESDVTKPSAGLSQVDLDFVCHQANISHFFHCAASVGFTLTLLDSATSNITSALTMQTLAAQSGGHTKFVHVSTAFVHGGKAGSESCPLPEELFSLDPYSPTKIYESMLGTQYYASKAMIELGFPNTYTFSKCVCEHLLALSSSDVETIILRPSIVGPAIENPCEGWVGDKPQTLVAAASLYLSYQWNLWCFGAHAVPYIPVDVVSMMILSKTINPAVPFDQETSSDSETHSSEDDFEKISKSSEASSLSGDSDHVVERPPLPTTAQHFTETKKVVIINTAWSVESPQSASFTWLQYAAAVTQLGSILGYFAKSSAYLGLFFTAKVQPKLFMTQVQYEKLHYVLVQLPLQLVLRLLEKFGESSSGLRILVKYIDLPILFYPFTSRSFYFQSDIIAPDELRGDRYVLMCVVAAERFLAAQKKKSKARSTSQHTPLRHVHKGVGLVIGGKVYRPQLSDFWSVLSEPRGGYCMRLAAWIFAKILRATCSEVMVDVSSFSAVAAALSGPKTRPLHIILAPTHRSLFDSLLLSYAFFRIPEMQIDTPFIIAADDFSRLPLIGWLARSLKAVFIQRGKGSVDPSLRSAINAVKLRKASDGGGACIEVFIEGTRSRDRRFVAPRTGFLRCLGETDGEHLLVPITINYERIPEQTVFASEAARGSLCQLSLGGLLSWLMDVANGKIHLGRVLITAGTPIAMNDKCETSQLTRMLQREQQAMVHVSGYHITAAALLLDKDVETVRGCLRKLRCLEWPDGAPPCDTFLGDVELPEDTSELFTIMLQFGHLLSPRIRASHPKWAKWLNGADSDTNRNENDDPAVREITNAVSSLFEHAELAVGRAKEALASKGFNLIEPDHLIQEASKTAECVPLVLLVAAATLAQGDNTNSNSGKSTSDIFSGTTHGDRLGRWGFHDSAFSVQIDRAGKSYVAMSGTRYSICGKQLTMLIPFIEAETQVKIDPTREVSFTGQSGCQFFPSELSPQDVELLRLSGITFSISAIDRARSGSGQSQEDVFLLRNNILFRIPDAVAWPKFEKEIVELVSLAKNRGWNLIPLGGGTNVTSATRCPAKDFDARPVVSVCMTMMNRILWVNEEDGLAHVEAGITGQALSAALHRLGYTVGHEPDSIEFSTLGGWIATKASGMKKNKYGNIEDIVKSVQVVTSNGVAWQGFGTDASSRTVIGRESRGLDLCSMMFGSEGCYGIIASAVIRISALPDTRDFECILFTDFECGLRFVRDASGLGSNLPASLRLFDNAHFRLGQALRPAPFLFQRWAKWLYFRCSQGFEEASCVSATIAYEGSWDEVQSQKRAIRCLASRHGGIRLGSRAGRAGYDLTFVIAYLRDFAMSYGLIAESFETFAPWSKINQIMDATKKCVEAEHRNRCLPGVPFVGCRVTQVYHEGVCLYFYLCLNTLNVEGPSSTFADIERQVREQILKSGGSLTHHHGVGKLRAPFTKSMDSDSFNFMLKSFKESIDKENTFGAGNGLFSFHSVQHNIPIKPSDFNN